MTHEHTGAHAQEPTGTQAGTRVDALLRDARARIGAGEAEILLAHVLEQPRAWLMAYGDAGVERARAARFEALIRRRVLGEPVAYLTGLRGFWTLDLEVDASVLIPRPETERLVELALARLPRDASARVADLGTGSGAIALAIASERPLAQVIAVDASIDALAIAARNRDRCGLGNVEFRAGDWLKPLRGERFDLMASNPPYIAQGDPHLSQGDLRFEPSLALSSGNDGLDAIRTIVAGAPAHLRPNGWLLLEHGLDQGTAVCELLEQAGLNDVRTVRDLEDRDRVSLGQRA